MTSERGWYPDPSNDHTMRFWTGTQWMGERIWNGTEWIDRNDSDSDGAPAATTAPTVAAPVATPVAAPVTTSAATRPPMTRTAWLLFAGCAVAAVGTMLPWEQDTTPFGGQVSAGPSSVPGGVAMLMGLLAAVVWVGWPTRVGAMSKKRCVGLTVVAAVLAIFAFGKFSALGNAASTSSAGASSGSDLFGNTSVGLSYHAGSGLYIYTAGVLAVWVGVVRAWLARRT
jgi:Protein of unknown function (DUF2510)